MGRMIYEWVSRHDRGRYDITLYSLSAAHDAWTARFQALGVPLIDLGSLPHDAAAARVREDDIDLLIDCCGHTRGAQQGILAKKPARVAATHIATPGPVGLRAIDYKLTDALAESDDAQLFVLERLLPVPGGVFPWRRYPAPSKSHRSSLGLAPGAFVCGAFVSLMKLSPRCLNLWRRLLEQLPGAVLAFSPAHASWHPAYLRWLQAHGIGPGRVVFVPRPPDEPGQLARYCVLDVALDPLPCGNVNGTMEALAMGVPVVTLLGSRHGERLGNALLSRFGVTETIARDEDEYVRMVRQARPRSTVGNARARRHCAALGRFASVECRRARAGVGSRVRPDACRTWRYSRDPMNPALRQALVTADGLLRRGEARSARVVLEAFAAQNETDKDSAEFQLLLGQAYFQDGDPGLPACRPLARSPSVPNGPKRTNCWEWCWRTWNCSRRLRAA